MKKILLLSILLAVSGCGVIDKASARRDMLTSKDQYKNCLVANPTSVANCDGYRLAYKADTEAFQQTDRGLRWGGNSTTTSIVHVNDGN